MKCLSNKTIDIHAARTGTAMISNNDVIKMLHAYIDIHRRFLAFNNVTMKLIEPNIDDNPAKCNERINESIDE